MYFKNLAKIYAADKVRFNVVSPGNVIFPGSRWEEKKNSDPSGTAEFIKGNVPLGSFITPAEIATAVRYFATSESTNTTGVVLEVDGGQSL
jgi:NAD(P)-dependent dehydrogenase (short-subunit alcohol dehydrogenase family)